jgi:hypothetical protein
MRALSFSEDDCAEYQESDALLSGLLLTGAVNVQNSVKQR